jgi:hypothetical protein
VAGVLLILPDADLRSEVDGEPLTKGQRVCPIDCSALCHFCSAWRREKPAASMSRALRPMAATNADSAANRKMALTKASMSPGATTSPQRCCRIRRAISPSLLQMAMIGRLQNDSDLSQGFYPILRGRLTMRQGDCTGRRPVDGHCWRRGPAAGEKPRAAGRKVGLQGLDRAVA